MNRRAAGTIAEHIASDYLRACGYVVIEKNFLVRGGEIDIICRQGRTLVFIEVKSRTSILGGHPEEMVTHKKLERLTNAIARYLESYKKIPAYRIDVISVDQTKSQPKIYHLENITLDTN